MASALDQHGVIVRSNDSSSEAVTTIQAHAVTTCRAVDLNLASVWCKPLGGVLGGDAALDGKTAGRDAILRQAELSKGGAGRDLDLGRDDVDSSNFFGDGVLDLAIS